MGDTDWKCFLISLFVLWGGYAWGRYAERAEQRRYADAWRRRG